VDANTVTAICATIIAVASLVVTVHQARATRRHNRLTLRPLLHLGIALVPGRVAGFVLSNVGLGPAIVIRTTVWLDGTPIGAWDRKNARLVRNGIDPRPWVSTLEDQCLRPGYKDFLIEVDSYDQRLHSSYRDLIDSRLDIEIHYESLYGGENYTVSTRSKPWRGLSLNRTTDSEPPSLARQDDPAVERDDGDKKEGSGHP
jgi:hypothetical protein